MLILVSQDTLDPHKQQVAIKILHAQCAKIGEAEATHIQALNTVDLDDVAHIIRCLDTFYFGRHFCIVFELMSTAPLPHCIEMAATKSRTSTSTPDSFRINAVRKVAAQLFSALALLRRQNRIHADLKPDNILLQDHDGVCCRIKLADFSNSMNATEEETAMYHNTFELQSLWYRAPEVIYGLPFGPPIDMWSAGCILAELFIGEPLFAGPDNAAVLAQMVELLGPLPRQPFLRGMKCSAHTNAVADRNSQGPVFTRKQAVRKLETRLGTTDNQFATFLYEILCYDPSQRLSPSKALCHSFMAHLFPFALVANESNKIEAEQIREKHRSPESTRTSQVKSRPWSPSMSSVLIPARDGPGSTILKRAELSTDPYILAESGKRKFTVSSSDRKSSVKKSRKHGRKLPDESFEGGGDANESGAPQGEYATDVVTAHSSATDNAVHEGVVEIGSHFQRATNRSIIDGRKRREAERQNDTSLARRVHSAAASITVARAMNAHQTSETEKTSRLRDTSTHAQVRQSSELYPKTKTLKSTKSIPSHGLKVKSPSGTRQDCRSSQVNATNQSKGQTRGSRSPRRGASARLLAAAGAADSVFSTASNRQLRVSPKKTIPDAQRYSVSRTETHFNADIKEDDALGLFGLSPNKSPQTDEDALAREMFGVASPGNAKYRDVDADDLLS